MVKGNLFYLQFIGLHIWVRVAEFGPPFIFEKSDICSVMIGCPGLRDEDGKC
jgi:hypothetical protein